MSSAVVIAAKLAGAIFEKLKAKGGAQSEELEARSKALAAAVAAHYLSGLVGEAGQADAELLRARALALESAGISGVAALVNEGLSEFVSAGINLVFDVLAG